MLIIGIDLEKAERWEFSGTVYNEQYTKEDENIEKLKRKHKIETSELFKYLPRYQKPNEIPRTWILDEKSGLHLPKNTQIVNANEKNFLVFYDFDNQINIQEMVRAWGIITNGKESIMNMTREFCKINDFRVKEPQFYISTSIKFSVGSFEIKERFFSIYELFDEMMRFSNDNGEILHLQKLGIESPNFYITKSEVCTSQ